MSKLSPGQELLVKDITKHERVVFYIKNMPNTVYIIRGGGVQYRNDADHYDYDLSGGMKNDTAIVISVPEEPAASIPPPSYEQDAEEWCLDYAAVMRSHDGKYEVASCPKMDASWKSELKRKIELADKQRKEADKFCSYWDPEDSSDPSY